MSRYKIGIPSWKIDNMFGVTLAYLNFITYFGEPVILNNLSEIRDDLDLLILPGGPDVDVSRYNQVPGFYTQKPCIYREYFDLNHLPKYIEAGVPVYGICRGMQSLAVHFGGALDQHINHTTNDGYDRQKLVHDVNIYNEYRMKLSNKDILYRSNYKTNSIHHQAVNKNSLKNSQMRVIGSNIKNSVEVVELIAHENLPIVGEQAHPEETFNDFSLKSIEYLIKYKRSIIS